MFVALPSRGYTHPVGADHPIRQPQPRLSVHGVGDPRRGELEDFIRRIYARRYGATVRHFAPVLVGLRVRGRIVAAAGYRPAAREALFLERYLAAPVETLLAAHADDPPTRQTIVEVGHLVAAQAGQGLRLVAMLASHLAAQRFEWVASTVTEELHHQFMRIGVAPLTLVNADPAMLGDEAADWGSYYAHRPRVLAGHLREALRQFAHWRTGFRSNP